MCMENETAAKSEREREPHQEAKPTHQLIIKKS